MGPARIAAPDRPRAGVAWALAAGVALLASAGWMGARSPAGVAGPTTAPEFRAVVGLGGCVRPGAWSCVRLWARNPGPEFRGRVSVRVSGSRSESVLPLTLPAGATRRMEIPFRPDAEAGRVETRVVRAADGALVWEAEAPLDQVGPLSDLLLATGRADVQVLGALLEEEGRGRNALLGRVVAGADLPEDARSWEAASALVLAGGGGATRIAPAAAQAIAAWVAGGGQLVLMWQMGWSPDPEVNRVLPTPAVEALEATLAWPRALRAFSDTVPESPPLVVGAAYLAAAGSGAWVRLKDAGIPLVIERRCGRGRITWVGLDLARPVWAKWPGTPALWRWIMGRDRGVGESPRVEAPSAGSVLDEEAVIRSALSKRINGQVRRPAPGWLLLFTAGYALLLGPGVYRISRRLGSAWAAGALPLLVGAFTGAAWGVGRATATAAAPPAAWALVVDALPPSAGGGMWVRAQGVLVSATHQDVSMRVPGPAVRWWTIAGHGDGVLGAASRSRLRPEVRWVQGDPGEERLEIAARAWIPEHIGAQWRLSAASPVRVRLREVAGSSVLEIECTAGQTLIDAVAVIQGKLYGPLGPQGPGTVRSVTLDRSWARDAAAPIGRKGGWFGGRRSPALRTLARLAFCGMGPGEPGGAERTAGRPAGLYDAGVRAGRRDLVLAWGPWMHGLPVAEGVSQPPQIEALFRVEVDQR